MRYWKDRQCTYQDNNDNIYLTNNDMDYGTFYSVYKDHHTLLPMSEGHAESIRTYYIEICEADLMLELL